MSTETKTTCPYCGVGCGVIAMVDDDGRVAVRGDPDHPANYGRLCSKGSSLAETLGPQGRGLHPQVHGRTADWDEALDLVASTFSRTIIDHGPDSVAFYLSGQLLTEDYYLANKLMKGFIGSANIDTNSRLCMASSVAGHRRAFGSDTVPGCYEDLELADLVVLVGSNMAWCHPVLFQRVTAAKAARTDLKVVVIDPRRTATCDIADLHLPVRADGDIAIFNGLLRHIAKTGRINDSYVSRHTSGLEEALEAASHIGDTQLCESTGLPVSLMRQFFELFGRTEKVVTCYSQGVNQSSVGTDKVNAILNCHLATGRIGRPGMGPLSLTGQPNAMGGREVGGLANMLAAHMAIEEPLDRMRVQRFWKSPTLAQKPGLKAVDMFKAATDGRIKAIWIMSTNPVVSMPDADVVKAALKTCPFVVVSDMQFDTDTARLAHVLLPAAGWGEKAGTVTNSERRISRQRPFLPPPGLARPDWWQIAEIAKRMGFESAFAYHSPAAIFKEHAALSGFENNGARAFDIGAHSSIDPESYDRLEPFQWPSPKNGSQSARFFGDGGFHTADGRARLIPVTSPQLPKSQGRRLFTLNTGRIRDHWHTMTRTGKSPRLSAHIAEPFCELHPLDAAEHGIGDADLVRIEGRNGGFILVRALITERQMRGALFVPMHWTGDTASNARVDTIVCARVDPVSGQPALKMADVSIARFDAVSYGFMVTTQRPEDLPFAYWAVARTFGGYRLEFAGDPPPDGWESWLRRNLLRKPGQQLSQYHDRPAGDFRLLAFKPDHLEAALFVSRAPVGVSRQWVVDQFVGGQHEVGVQTQILAGRPGAGTEDKGRIVCACHCVGANQIAAALGAGCRSLEAIGRAVNAGTNCGSCRPEIRRMIDATQVLAAE